MKPKVLKKGAKKALETRSVGCCLNVPVVIYPEGRPQVKKKVKGPPKLS